jgi:hypothetical protein
VKKGIELNSIVSVAKRVSPTLPKTRVYCLICVFL